jgi:protein TonB
MQVSPEGDVYSAREIALAAGVAEADVVALVGRRAHVPYREALRIGRTLASRGGAMFLTAVSPSRATGVPLVLSSTLHLGLVAAVALVTSWMSVPTATALSAEDRAESPRMVFLAIAGPGGGGGGGGLLQRAPVPKALSAGHQAIGSPIPSSTPPRVTPAPLDAEPLPVVVAPIVVAPSDSRNQIGLLVDATLDSESRGSGRGGGAGAGTGTGLGEGDGNGVGPGSGGGVGGGRYRPGSGIEPPRVLHEVKAAYPEDARRRAIAGDVVLEIVVRRDGSVGDVRIVQGLAGGLSERAVQAVRQWQFEPARRLGVPVDVMVEVAVEFKLR